MEQCVVVQDLQEAQADLASLKQASQAGAEAAPAPQMQQEEAAQHRSSTLQVLHLSNP